MFEEFGGASPVGQHFRQYAAMPRQELLEELYAWERKLEERVEQEVKPLIQELKDARVELEGEFQELTLLQFIKLKLKGDK